MSKGIDYIARIGWQENLEGEYFAFGYIRSYKDAADILVEERQPDLLIFPIMFSYRQYLELLLKNIYYIRKKDEYNAYVKKVSHNLLESWNYVKEIIKKEIKEDNMESSLGNY